MMSRRLDGTGWPWRALLLCAVALSGACGGEPPPVEEAAGAPQLEETVDPAPDTTPSALRRFLPDEMQRSTRAETFAHDAHVQIDCAVCHEVAEGHGSHESIECADCHLSSALVTLDALSPAECRACHHGAEQAFDCVYCHESPGAVVSTQQLAFDVWASSRARDLDFEHARHASVACSECHVSAPALTPAESCATCHAEHHTTEVRCASCHLPPPESAHDVQAHLTCSGSGCHSVPAVEAIAETRTVCLSCHQDQAGHEPGGQCVECHRVQGDAVAGVSR